MPQVVNFLISTKFPQGGPTIPPATRVSNVGSNMAVMEEVPNDRNWAEFEVLGGERGQIEYMMITADKYKDEHCPREDEPGLLFKFDEGDGFALHLDGPVLYCGHTVSCLPPRIDKIYLQNRMADRVKFYLVLGRKPKKNAKNGNGQTNSPASTTPASTGSGAPSPAPTAP